MCGIVGVLKTDGTLVDRERVQKMRDTVLYRGPDSAGVWCKGAIGFGHRRLAIIDLTASADQPFVKDGAVLVFNGEIYNYKELADEYLRGVDFKSNSDTEVLLELLRLRGETILSELRGMFAFAFWNGDREELLLARDPFGKKPLYYRETEYEFIFASEMKSLMVVSSGEGLDRVACVQYFLHEYVPSPQTPLEHIQQVPAGSWLKLVRGSTEVRKWWTGLAAQKTRSEISENQALSRLDELLYRAVKRRLVSDVPVGILLSGGLDSSTIAWYARQQKPSEDIHSFSVSFEDSDFNEGGVAGRVAQSLSFVHYDEVFDVEQFFRIFGKLEKLLDIPFADASLLPTYLVSEMARRDVVVVLDGDGSDELQAGYGTFQAARVAERMPSLLRDFLAFVAPFAYKLPTSHGYFSWDFKMKSFVRGIGYGLSRRNQIWLGAFSDTELKRLLVPHWHGYIAHVFDSVDRLARELRIGERLVDDAISRLTASHYMHNGILTKLDRATMYNSLEARTPFLDTDLAEFLLSLPDSMKRDKRLLRILMRGRIPDEVIDRPKQGFALPIGRWLRSDLRQWMQRILNEDDIRAGGVLHWPEVRRIMREHVAGKADHRKKLWTLIMWQVWHTKNTT